MASEPRAASLPASDPEQPRAQLYRSRELLDIAALYSEDADLWVFRRFNTLHLFNTLYLQRRLSQLEEKLLRLKDGEWLAGNAYKDEEEVSLHKLVVEIRETLKSYDEAISAQLRSHNHRSPRPKKVRDLAYLARKHRMELCRELGIEYRVRRARVRDPEEGPRRGCDPRCGCGPRIKFWGSSEADQKTKLDPLDPYVGATEGLASIAAVEKSWMHRFVDGHGSLRRMFAKGDVKDGTVPLLIYSEKSIQRAEQIVVNVGFCLLLICPIFLLSYLNDKGARLGIFVAFVVTGSVLTSGLIHGGNIGNLAVMAGYAAILVVFLNSGVNSH